MRGFLIALLFAFAFAASWNPAGRFGQQTLATARADEAAEVLAIQLRRQGHQCESPVSAERDLKLSKPDEPVWIVKCGNIAYRMRLVPHQAAEVERI